MKVKQIQQVQQEALELALEHFAEVAPLWWEPRQVRTREGASGRAGGASVMSGEAAQASPGSRVAQLSEVA